MALAKSYPADFERLWKAFPKWPAGRSKKEPSFKAFAKVKKELGFTEGDIAAIEMDIERRKRDCANWQHGSKFGPEMFSTYMNQHRWNEPYEKVKAGSVARDWSGHIATDDENQRKYWQSVASQGGEVPDKYRHYLGTH